MRNVGTTVRGIRTPILAQGDDLVEIVAQSLIEAAKTDCFKIEDNDIVAVTEAVVAKTQGNYATTDDIAADIKEQFGGGHIGVVYPILSRNRFEVILKGIAKGADKTAVLLNYPQDEVGNPVVDLKTFNRYAADDHSLYTAAQFKQKFGDYKHHFTGVNYMDAYSQAGGNVSVYASKDPAKILEITKNVIAADIHSREETKRYLLEKGAKKVITLADILCKPVNGSGFNERYGVLGSNTATASKLKLFPKNCEYYVTAIRDRIKQLTGKNVEVLIYGDGGFKDPICGIWELADPVIAPAYTARLGESPNEIKLKRVADEKFAAMNLAERTAAAREYVGNKANKGSFDGGTTPRKMADLLGSLADLTSGSGDKGTPVVHIKGYFDNYSIS